MHPHDILKLQSVEKKHLHKYIEHDNLLIATKNLPEAAAIMYNVIAADGKAPIKSS